MTLCFGESQSNFTLQRNGRFPAKYRIEKEQDDKESFLDPNHSHFILVDNATQHKFDVEIPFSAKLKKEIAHPHNETGEDAVSVPNILLVLGGSLCALENVYQAILNDTPTVVVKGSGRAANILAYAYLNAKEEEIEATDHSEKRHKTMGRYLEDSVEITIKEMLKHEFKNEGTLTHLEQIRVCLMKSDLMSVYEMEGKGGVNDIDVTIFQALFKAKKFHEMDLLKLALAWNRIDVAKSDIFTDDKTWPKGTLNDVMFSAILLNRVDFVKLFLDNGVSLKEFLTTNRLLMLYNKIPSNCLLRTLLDSSMTNKEISLNDVEGLIRDIIGESLNVQNSILQNKAKRGEKLQPVQLLFIWSILMIRQDMAKLFWAEGNDAIAAALVGNMLLKYMVKNTNDTELVNKIQTYIKEWSDLAVGVLSECHFTDELKAQDLLERDMSNWGHTSCLLIAVKTNSKEFISQTACQSLLNRIWNGRLAQYNSLWRLLFCVFFPPLLWVLPAFTKLDTYKTCDNINKESKSPNNKDEKLKMTAREKFCYFYKAPVIIFLYNVCSHLVFLSLYTYILIFKFDPNVSVEEIILMFWVFTVTTEEVRQMLTNSSTTLATKLKSYFTDTWNVVDTLTIAMFIFGITLRFLPYESTFEFARVVLAFNFVTFFLRLLRTFSIHKELGPKLVMISKMMQDLIFFLLILMVFMFSYAIASHSILYPNSPLTWKTAVQIIRNSYWNIYGDLLLDEIEGDTDCSYDTAIWINGTQARCPTDTGKWVVPIMMGIYMLLANVLLLNLLIAMFSNTIRTVQDNADKHWHFQRYFLIHDYYTRPVLVPPFILLSHIFLVFRFICKSSCCKDVKKKRKGKEFCRKIKNESEIIQWERVIADAFHLRRELDDVQNLKHKVDSAHKMLAKMDIQLESTKKTVEWLKTTIQKSPNENKPWKPAPETISSNKIRTKSNGIFLVKGGNVS